MAQVNFLAIILSVCSIILLGVGVYYMGKSDESGEAGSERIGGGFALAFGLIFLIAAGYVTFKKKDIKVA